MNGTRGFRSHRLAILALLVVMACASGPTTEESALAAVEEIRTALNGDDADAVWELLSTRHQNLYEEARLLRAGLVDPPAPYSPLPRDLLEIGDEVSPGEAAGMTTREFHRALYVPADLPSVGEGAAVRTLEEWTRVDDVQHGNRWWLRREEGRWKLAALVPPDFPAGEGLVVYEGPSGHEVAVAVYAELTWKKVHEVPLPVVPGDAGLEEHHDFEVRVALDLHRRTEVRWEFVEDAGLKERLLSYAERKRDMEHPAQYSVVPFLLAIHRDLKWRRVEEVLWIMADADVRIGRVSFLTAEYPDDRRGVEVVLRAQARPTQVRHEEPDVEVRIGKDAMTSARLAGLAKALAALPDAKFEKGIRTIVSPDLPVGAALSAAVVVGQRGKVVHHLAEEPFEGLTLDGRPVAEAERAEPGPEPQPLHLTLVIRLPPGAETPTTLFRRLLIALERGDQAELRRLLAPSATLEGDPYGKVKGATLKEVTVDGDHATVSFDGPGVLGVLYLVREDGRWYLAPGD